MIFGRARRGAPSAGRGFPLSIAARNTQPQSLIPPMCFPRAVVFDFDGLMFNTEDVYFMVGTELLRRRGRTFTRPLSDAMTGLPPRPSFEVMIQWHALSDSWEALAAESEELFLALLDAHLAPMPGLMDLLERLEEAGIPKAICTSSSRRLLSAVLQRFDVTRRFLFILTAEDITHGKPHPEVYLAASQRFGIEPRQMLVLEDSQIGCRSAASAGALVVAVPGKHTAHQDFTDASMVVDSLADPRLYEVLGLKPTN